MNWSNLALRLERKYGLGNNAFAARKVYAHVERLCHAHGDPVYTIVQDMVNYADRRGEPGKNFRAFILRRIEEHGFAVRGKAGGPNDPNMMAEVAAMRERIGSDCRQEPRPAVGSDGTRTDTEAALRAELDRVRMSNELLKRDLAAVRGPREGGSR